MGHSVLHLNFADNEGGAARSAYKIHSGLRQLGWTSHMLVRKQITDDPNVDEIQKHQPWLRVGDALSRKLLDRQLGLENWYYPSSSALVRHPWFQAADVMQFYNLHPYFFSHRVLPHLSQQKPVVWRLPDMWAFTGHCTYSYECDRWQTGCGQCPHLDSYPALRRDTTALLWREKQRIYHQSRLTIVVTNRWMESLLQKSPLLSHLPVCRIPNGVNTQVFYPIPQSIARQALQISTAAHVVLFVGAVTTDTRKGCEYVQPLMERLAAAGVPDLVLLVVGKGAETWKNGAGYRVVPLEQTGSDRFLSIAYAAANVFVHPALVENFPNTILESMACGTPWIAFDIGGIGDLLQHSPTGYLAAYQDVEDLVQGTLKLLTEPDLRERMSRNCRSLIEMEYTQELQAQRFAQLYEKVIDCWTGL
jgi:glycosyltransferase involved in cell wall biosynthesis